MEQCINLLFTIRLSQICTCRQTDELSKGHVIPEDWLQVDNWKHQFLSSSCAPDNINVGRPDISRLLEANSSQPSIGPQ